MLWSSIVVGTLVTLLLVDHTLSRAIHSFAGPYIAYAHQFEACPSEQETMLYLRGSHFNPLKPYEHQILSGNMTFTRSVRDDFWTHVTMAARSNNQWKENAMVFKFPKTGCTVIRANVPDFFRIISKYSGAPTDPKTPCVMPAATFTIKNESIKWEFPNFPVVPYGRYRLTVTARDGGSPSSRILFCEIIDCEVIPKP